MAHTHSDPDSVKFMRIAILTGWVDEVYGQKPAPAVLCGLLVFEGSGTSLVGDNRFL